MAIRFYEGDFPILFGNNDKGNGFRINIVKNKIKDKGLLNSPKIFDFKNNKELTNKLNYFTEFEIFEINS